MSRRQHAARILGELMTHAYEAGAASKDPFAKSHESEMHLKSAKELKDLVLDLVPESEPAGQGGGR